MTISRIFDSRNFFQPTDDKEPIRSIVTQSKDATVVAWHIKKGQKIALHMHPNGQDTWTILAGKGHYYLNSHDASQAIKAGDIVIAHSGEVHGVLNNDTEPLVFISVVSPADAGHQLV
ncbi:MAG: cupin domain-containing protein [Methylococcales bacterium]|nr:cupin domain-containing protein [Methylococcales bacterium]